MSYRTNKEYVALRNRRHIKDNKLKKIKEEITELDKKTEIIRIKHLIKVRVCSTPFKDVANHFKEKGFVIDNHISHYNIFPRKD
jgi:Na+-transporting NADH:ubiquinone oxidoreductase subunit NqrC